MSRTKKITLGISTTVLALGLGFGAAEMASATTTPSPAPSVEASADSNAGTPAEGKGMRGGHGDRGQLAANLATKLGVDEAKATSALQAFRDANRPATGDGTKPDRSARDAALATHLAGALGVEESKVAAALEEIAAENRSQRAAAMKTKLDSAVTDGTLTQAEADAVTKAVEKGVIGGGR